MLYFIIVKQIIFQNTKFNSHIIINDNGEIISIYRKIHLFDVAIPEKNIFLRESDFNIGGSQISLPVTTPAGLLGLAIVSFQFFTYFSHFCFIINAYEAYILNSISCNSL